MAASPPERSPLATAMEWLAVASTVAGSILVLGWLGSRLDHWLGTKFFTGLGFVIGLVAGIAYLLAAVKRQGQVSRRAPHQDNSDRNHGV